MKVLQEITVPQESVNDQTLIVLELFFKHGDPVTKGAVIMELETSKTAIAVESDFDGFISYFCKEGDEVLINARIAQITDQKPAPVMIESKEKVNGKVQSVKVKVDETIFSNAALALIQSANLNKNIFEGYDFVSKQDVASVLGNAQSQKSSTGKSPKPLAIIDEPDKVELKKVSSFKKKEIEYLSSVQSAGLRSTVNVQLDTKGVSAYLGTHLRYFKNSLLPVIVYECSRLLLKFRELNAYFSNDHVAFYKDVNVGFAIDIGKGLKVVKIGATSAKTIAAIEEEIFSLSNDYLDEKLKTEALTDITFTITDLSGEGVFSFTPLINMKNSAILGISAIDQAGQCMLSISFDHRVTEGRQAALFLSELKTRLASYSSASHDASAMAGRLSLISCYKCYKKLTEDISGTGFAKCITPDGAEGYICQSCFKGF